MINKKSFDKYLKQRYFDEFPEKNKNLKAEDIIFTSFNSWKYNYEDHLQKWFFIRDGYFCNKKYKRLFPYIVINNRQETSYKIIKFLTKRDYKRFSRYYRRYIYTGSI